MKLSIYIPADIIGNDRLEKLIKKFGKETVKKALGEYFAYEVLRNIGDVYANGIPLDAGDYDALEEILKERR